MCYNYVQVDANVERQSLHSVQLCVFSALYSLYTMYEVYSTVLQLFKLLLITLTMC